jgi:hypothetical protein
MKVGDTGLEPVTPSVSKGPRTKPKSTKTPGFRAFYTTLAVVQPFASNSSYSRNIEGGVGQKRKIPELRQMDQPPEHHIHHTLKKMDQLLTDSDKTGPVTNEMAHTIAFLFTKVGEQADNQANSIRRLTLVLVLLTIILAVMTVVQLVVMLRPSH